MSARLDEIVDRVLRSPRYRDVSRGLVHRLAGEEVPRARNPDDAAKRVKRRLHQAVGAFRGERRADVLDRIRAAWAGDLGAPAVRAACADALRTHASTAERVPHLDDFYSGIWEHSGVPGRLIDIGCGLGPLALPWMGIGRATYLATDVDERPLQVVRSFLELVGQPHAVRTMDAVAEPPVTGVDLALLLKLVPTLDRQDADAATRLLSSLRARHAVVSFPGQSLSGRAKGMERSYRERFERLVADAGRVSAVAEASVPNELVFVLTLEPVDG